MRDLNFQLKTLCHRHKEGSYRTRHDRHTQLQAIATQIHNLGFRHLQASGLKQKHVQALVAHWQSTQISDGVIKNRMATVRWWARKSGCPAAICQRHLMMVVCVYRLPGRPSRLKKRQFQINYLIHPENSEIWVPLGMLFSGYTK